MKITLNGEPQAVSHTTTLAMVVASVADQLTGVAAAVNDDVVRREDWQTTELHDDDRVEVLTAMQGG